MQSCGQRRKRKNIPDAELLYDTYLYEKAEEWLLKDKVCGCDLSGGECAGRRRTG